MSPMKTLSWTQPAVPLLVALSIAFLGLIAHFQGFGTSNSLTNRLLHSSTNTWGLVQPKPDHDEQKYSVRVFSRDPSIVIIDSFVSPDEISHLLRVSEDRFEISRVFSGYESRVDRDIRDSESANLDVNDEVVRRVQSRAQRFQGWRKTYKMEVPKAQRYQIDGFFDYHYDWDAVVTEGNRATTFMIYLTSNCTGGGTNFPFLPMPNDTRWCDVIECTEEGRDGFQGVTFKARTGSAIFWENFHPNGSTHDKVYHAGLPVKSGTKVGLNIWSWDTAWRSPTLDS